MTLKTTLLCSLAATAMTAAALHAQQMSSSVEVITTTGPLAGGTAMLPVQQTGSGMLVGQVVDATGNRPISGAIVAIGGSLNMAGGAPAGPRVFVGVRAGSISAAADRIRCRA